MASVGVIVGRFQVDNLHEGHRELFNKVREKHATVIAFLGVSPMPLTRRNPLDFFTRKLMIQDLYPDVMVLSIPDARTDEAWSAELDKRIKELVPLGDVVLYGGRDSFLPHYKGKYKAEKLYTNYMGAGTTVREKSGNKVMESSAFRAGIIYATQNQFPRALPCVDVAILDHQEGPRILLARKAGEEQWRFVGGHVDPSDATLEYAAKREVREETGLELESLDYVGSVNVADWRSLREVDKIVSAFFLGYNSFGAPRAADDIVQVQWFIVTKLKESDFIKEHRPLWHMLAQHLGLENKSESYFTDGLIQADALEAVPSGDDEGLLVP